MYQLSKLFWTCKIVLVNSQCYVPKVVPISKLFVSIQSVRVFVNNFDVNIERNMSQKSITSFFKVTPKKSPEKKEEIKERSSKRPRLESSDSDSQSPKATKKSTTPVSSEKVKKSKRQRIESSGSESELKETENIEVKVEQSGSPKTYSSPKNRKIKVKVEKSPLNVKNEEKQSKLNKNDSEKKKDTKSPKSSPTSPKKSKVKQESKTVNSFFTKKEIKTEKSGDEKENEEDTVVPVPETEYNPAKTKYHPITDACWSKGQDVPYLALAKTLEAIEATSARLKIVEILSNYFRSVIALTPDDLLPSVYMCLNQLAPAYHSLELGIAETYLMKAVGQCTGRTLAQVKAAAQKAGDLGTVAEQARAQQRTMFAPKPLMLRKVFAALKEIAHMTGQSSVNKKIAKIQQLYTACRYSEARYLIRSLEGKLRIGLAEQSVLQALGAAAALTPGPTRPGVVDAGRGLDQDKLKALIESHAQLVKSTYCECPNYELVVPALVTAGAAALPRRCALTPGIPLKPMLAHPTKGLTEIFNRFDSEPFTCEWKYDGERAQIHVPAGDGGPDYAQAAIYSRNQENNTSKYPDVLGRLPSLLKPTVTSCVLDTEAVAYDTENNKILPFQILSTRKRKDAVASEIKVQVCVFVFDVLYLNGRALVRDALQHRRQLLREHFNEVPGCWQFAVSRDCSSVEEVQQFLDESVRGSCEGLMVKCLQGDNARYDIARRSHNWLKLKKDYLEGVGDSIDAVVIGAWWGRGKRAGLLGGFLLACRDPDSEELQALCKLGTGFSDEDLTSLTAALKEHIIDAPRNYYRVSPTHVPDVWLSAGAVWEVRCADLSLSPAHRAAIGLVDPDKGISLRFPRFIRVRDDKTPDEATSAQQIAEMYLSQDVVKNQAPRQINNDDFY